MQFNDSDVILGFKEVRNYSLNDSKGKHKRKCIKKQKKLESSLSFKAISKSKISKRGNDKSKTVSTSVLSYAGKFESTTIGDEDLCDWKHLNLPEPILQSLKVQEFYQPTSIQNAVISNALLSRKHVAIAAPTGSGKTLCYAIPILSRLIENNWDKANNDRLYSLVLVPTRELAIQVKNHMQNLSAFTEVKILAIVGGIAEVKQLRLIKRNPHIIVATPGRLWNLYNMGIDYLCDPKVGIQSVSTLVLDEADRLFEHAHFSELRSLLDAITKNDDNNVKRQCFFLSATLSTGIPSENVHDLSRFSVFQTITTYINVQQSDVKIFDFTTTRRTVDGLDEKRVMCEFDEKDIYLYYIITTRKSERTLVFANSIASIKRLAALLTELKLKPFVLHAKMHQKHRLKNLEIFSGCAQAVLLATDVAARGLDIPKVDLIIHYQLPRTVELYIHRSGRTARGTETLGNTILLICPDEAKMYNALLNQLNRGKHIDQYEIDYHVLDQYRQLVKTTTSIEKLKHLLHRESSNYNWFQKMVKECDIDPDDCLASKQDHRQDNASNYKQELSRLTNIQNGILQKLKRNSEMDCLRNQLCT